MVNTVIDHLDPDTIQPGDVMLGTLPIHMVARVSQYDGRYLHPSLATPLEQRGQ